MELEDSTWHAVEMGVFVRTRKAGATGASRRGIGPCSMGPYRVIVATHSAFAGSLKSWNSAVILLGHL